MSLNGIDMLDKLLLIHHALHFHSVTYIVKLVSKFAVSYLDGVTFACWVE